MRFRNRTSFLVILRTIRAGLISAALLSVLPPLNVAGQNPEALSVNDPRPLSAAVALLEQRCHCPITYEDPEWKSDDVVDSGPHWPARIPKGGPFTFDAPDLRASTPADTRRALEQVLRTFEQTASGRGAFRVTNDATAVHVVPREGSILDTPVTIAPGTRPLGEVVMLTLGEVERVTGQKVGLATGPINFFQQRRIEIEAQQEAAGDVLVRALAASGRQLSWRLFYDLMMQEYYLSIHFVP